MAALPPLRYVKAGDPAPYRQARQEDPEHVALALHLFKQLRAHGWTYRHHYPDAQEPLHVIHVDLIQGGVLVHKLAGASETCTSALVILWIHATKHKSTVYDKARRPR